MTNKITHSLLALAVGGLLVSGSALAQTSTQSTPATTGPGGFDPGHPRVNEVNRRQDVQQHRIAQGVKNGSLTPAEAARLQQSQANIQRHEQKMMAQDGGHLTKQDQHQLNRAENRQSRKIYQAKHN